MRYVEPPAEIGELLLSQPANPGAGVNLSITIPINRLWRINTIQFTFSTNATVIGRIVKLEIDNGTTTFCGTVAEIAQGQDTIQQYRFMIGWPGLGTSLSNAVVWPVELGTTNDFLPSLYLPAGYRVRTVITNLQATDSITNPKIYAQSWRTG